ncbi:hypothetical protein PP304_gp162 [Gordonia phage Phendrix]|uniref:Uncharacterized protein n=2 Tax=Godonkavirus TaxID=2733178 RepID=A0A4D6E2Q4_9CAUD|nr:hypothetical protein HOV33_gp165 [Gordonia phage GodonK]YP_010649205.1 hypothetical protein PP304_gp162 [Gordonia phage Phendrix]QBZ72791.1 hypothetical protein SEA_GODONK_203 [Gordonia phage GodonK]QDK02707.1 hypothetical protein SEA_PHENDRIX_191 [Gordonia phage Phendrix]
MFVRSSLRFLGVTVFRFRLEMGDNDAPSPDGSEDQPLTLVMHERSDDDGPRDGGSVTSDTMPFGFANRRDNDDDDDEEDDDD